MIAILSGVSDSNILFSDLCGVLEMLGFQCRITGRHHIYCKSGIEEIINTVTRQRGLT